MLRDRMTHLKQHEKTVLDILVSGTIPDDVLEDIRSNPKITKYCASGNGYFLTITHPSLPTDRIVCHKPIVIGECSGIDTGFVVFIENGELTIECHCWVDKEIPKDYRDLNVQITVVG